MSDTSEIVEKRYREMLLALTPSERLSMACRMFTTVKSLMRAGIIKSEGADCSPERIRELMFLRLYGCDFDAIQREKIIKHIIANHS